MNSYSDEEIIETLNTIFSLEATKKDLVDCKSEFVQNIYVLFIKDFGASVEKLGLNQMPLNAPTAISLYPEMFRSTTFLMALAKTVQFYLNRIYNSTDFEPRDVFTPNYQRSRRFFIQLIDFYEHIYENIGKFNAVETEAQEENEKFENVRKRAEKLKKEIKQRRMENAEHENRLQKEHALLCTVKRDIEEVQEVKNRFKGRLEGIKDEIKSVGLRIKETELQICENKQELCNLNLLVLQDEEISEIENRKEMLTSLKSNNVELKEQLTSLKQNLQNKKKAKNVITSTMLPVLEDIKQGFAKTEDVRAIERETEKIISSLLEKYEDVMRKNQHLVEKINLLQENQAQLQNSKEGKKAGLLEEVRQLKLSKEQLVCANEKHDDAEKRLTAETLCIEEESEKCKAKLKIFVNFVEALYDEILQELNSHLNDLEC